MDKINPFEIDASQQQSRPRWRDDDNIVFEEDDFSYASSGSGSGGDYGHSESIHLLDDEEVYDDGYSNEDAGDDEEERASLNPIRLVCMSMIASVCFAIAYMLSTDSDNATHDNSTAPLPLVPVEDPDYRLVVLGERNSGVPWVMQQLARCYPDTEVTNILQRSGEWFQDKALYQPQPQHQNTLVIALFLNPYDWVNAMRLNPIHMPSHTNITSWKTFLTTTWTDSKGRPKTDASLLHQQNAHPCQFNFTYNQVLPCTPSISPHDSTYPVYELMHMSNATNPTGEPYNTILDLRRDKILNFLDVQHWEPQTQHKKSNTIDMIVVKYDNLMKANDKTSSQENGKQSKPGLTKVLTQISQLTGLQSICNVESLDKETNDDGVHSYIAPPPTDNFVSAQTLSPKYVSYINKHVDWEVEGYIGYKPKKAN